MNPKYPIYIISKGRWESRLTVKTLDKLGVPYSVVIEQDEYDQYAAVIDPSRLIILDPVYKDVYDTCDDLGDSMTKGSGPARNFVWDHAVSTGTARHWLLDDNIRDFYRLHQHRRIRVSDGTCLRVMEDFTDRYSNVALAGPQYKTFVPGRQKFAPFVLNSRIYSCILIKNDLPFRWRARFNEDTDLSLRVLKMGWCSIEFYAFLQDKMRTQTMRGGNTDELYALGTDEKSKMIVRLHPDVARLTYRYGRKHHFVDYRRFKANRLKVLPGSGDIADIDYGLRLIDKTDPARVVTF